MARPSRERLIPAPTRSPSKTRRSTPKAGSCTSRATPRTRRGRRSHTSSTARLKIFRNATARLSARGKRQPKKALSKSAGSRRLAMKIRAVGAAFTLTGLLLAVAPGMAHHEILAKFDDTKPTTLKGIVTLVDWANPHVHVFINVSGGKELVNWAIEYESPIDLQHSGWNVDSLQPGDAISVQGIAARDGSHQVWSR